MVFVTRVVAMLVRFFPASLIVCLCLFVACDSAPPPPQAAAPDDFQPDPAQPDPQTPWREKLALADEHLAAGRLAKARHLLDELAPQQGQLSEELLSRLLEIQKRSEMQQARQMRASSRVASPQ